MMKPLYIYNLFPRLYKNTEEWIKNIDHISDMGFNCIYINPFHYPGFSGSLYAPKDYYKYNPVFFTAGKSEEEHLKDFIAACNVRNIDVYMDLVVNHTSIDCILINEHKNWYLLLENGEIKRPGAWENGKYVTWGDLATFDLENSPDKANLWQYLLDMCTYYAGLGFKGFRCDAAYQVPNEFWFFLINSLRKKHPDTIFLAETLGCTPVQIQSISGCGFNYIFNSSKWWNFNESWCLEQYSLTRNIAPSISFPETHDTQRLFDELNGNETAFLQRLYFAALFSKGLMITSGFEYGFRKKLNVTSTTPEDWEKTGKDFSGKIKKILSIKNRLNPLNEESIIDVVDQQNWQNVFCFMKEWDFQRVMIIINKDLVKKQKINIPNAINLMRAEKLVDFSPESRIEGNMTSINFELNPGEVKIIAGEGKKS
jgi:starch synthase (maltosyl-transferring)